MIEPRMTGLVLLADPPGEEHLRLRSESCSVDQPSSCLFWDRRGLGTVRLLDPRRSPTLIDAKLGVDALVITADQLRDTLRQQPPGGESGAAGSVGRGGHRKSVRGGDFVSRRR